MPSVTVSSSDEETGGGSIGQGLLMGNDIRATPGTRRGAASSASDRYMSVMSSLFEECQSHYADDQPCCEWPAVGVQHNAIPKTCHCHNHMDREVWPERRILYMYLCTSSSPHFYSPHLYTILLSKIAP